ncbi:phosphoenolpyruvate--protein phosphotransferase [bacterium]|nr:phosphoenolpyruvate--protein phosphotransferase [bacterium]
MNLLEKTFIGLPTAPGIAIGEVFILRHDIPEFREQCILEEKRDYEITRLEESLIKTRRQLDALRTRMEDIVGDSIARIFDAQAAILDDIEFKDPICEIIRDDGLNAEFAVSKIAQKLVDTLHATEDEIFRVKAQDINDVARRIVKNLLGKSESAIGPLKRPAILVTDNLLPSDVIHLLRENVQAVASDLGGVASHTAILTRSLGVPSVVGLKDLTKLLAGEERIIVNGNSGKVILNPSQDTINKYQSKKNKYEEYLAELSDIEHLPAETKDGHRIIISANIELPSEVKSVISHGIEGIGLFRSEYLFLTRNAIPVEEDQYRDYCDVIRKVAPYTVTIRTFDLGGDKVFTDLPIPTEPNPFMGWRAIRVFSDEPKFLRAQIRAILRAAAIGPARIMFPFVSDLDEVLYLKEMVQNVIEKLEEEGKDYDGNIEIGIMIELPSAVMLADRIAKEVDFFSIGTNDLTQFVLAVDRGNEKVSSLYRPLHPAVIRMIKTTVDAGHSEGIEVALCGELAANPIATMLLVGLGVDVLSISPFASGEIKKIIRSMNYHQAVDFANEALKINTYKQLKAYCIETMKHQFADAPIWFENNNYKLQ